MGFGDIGPTAGGEVRPEKIELDAGSSLEFDAPGGSGMVIGATWDSQFFVQLKLGHDRSTTTWDG